MIISFNRFHRWLLSGLILSSLTCNFSFAIENTKESVIHEVGLAIPWKHFDNAIRAEFPSEKVQTYDYENLNLVIQDVPFVIPKTKVSTYFTMQSGEFKNMHGLWSLSPFSIKIETGAFKIEKTISENVGGVIVNVKLNAECQGVTLLQQKADARIGIAISTNGAEVKSDITELAFQWNESWWVDSIVCQGPRGFGDMVAKELRTKLSDVNVVENLVKETLQNQLQKQMQVLVKKALIPQVVYGDGQRQIILKYKKIEALGDSGLMIMANLDIPHNSNDPATHQLKSLVLASTDLQFVQEKPVLFLPQEAFLESTRFALSSYVFRGDLTDFSSFQSLMKSRFIQFFVWPDLRKYPKDSKFPFQTKVQTVSTLNFGKGLDVKMSAVIESWLQSTRANEKWNYLYVNSPLSTSANLSVANGELTLKLDHTKLKSKAQMYPEYITRFKPSKSISTSIIDGAIKSSVLSKGLNIKLPVFKLKTNEYKATRILRSSEQNLAIEF